jgi:phosphatidylinositol alpha 1,6-mannosyltransferase
MRVPKIPLVAAWHTNVHQYACLRLLPLLALFPCALRASASSRIESGALRISARFYQIARLILAPNTEILNRLTCLTGKPGRLLPHGVDTELFR